MCLEVPKIEDLSQLTYKSWQASINHLGSLTDVTNHLNVSWYSSWDHLDHDHYPF